jgi:hypothetical protein
MTDSLIFGLAVRDMPESGDLRAAAQVTVSDAYTARDGGKPFLMSSRWIRLGSSRIGASGVLLPSGLV